jgi:hypothetical protein
MTVQMSAALKDCNGICLVSRDRMLRQAEDRCPDILPYVYACYGDAGFLFLGAHLVRATTGLHQGDPLGPLLLAVAIHPPLISKRDGFQGLLQGWFRDDGTLQVVGDTEVVRDVLHGVLFLL